MKYRHSKIDSQSFLFSAKESNEEYYRVAYELTKKLFVGMSKHALAFNSKKYNFLLLSGKHVQGTTITDFLALQASLKGN